MSVPKSEQLPLSLDASDKGTASPSCSISSASRPRIHSFETLSYIKTTQESDGFFPRGWVQLRNATPQHHIPPIIKNREKGDQIPLPSLPSSSTHPVTRSVGERISKCGGERGGIIGWTPDQIPLPKLPPSKHGPIVKVVGECIRKIDLVRGIVANTITNCDLNNEP